MLIIPDNEKELKDDDVLSAFDYSYEGLEKAGKAYEEGRVEDAKREIIRYFETRKNASYFFDYRSLPLKSIDTDINPYYFQSALGLTGDLKSFCMYVADKMMDNIYVLPGKGRGEVDLGRNLENMIMFSFLTDMGKRHRGTHDQFVRGQFFESLAVAYHETGDEKYLKKLCQMLKRFFETYPLEVADGSPTSNRFQYTDDRDVMSLGWLTIVYISLFYTRAPYEIDTDTAFEIIKRIWFQGIQFRRFDTDSYRPYNHHLFERGLMPFFLGTLLPEFPEFRPMKERGKEIVRLHIKDDFNEYGGYSEHSIAYWSGAALGEMITKGIILSKLNNEDLLDKEAEKRISKSFSLLAYLASPGERYPSVGDNRGNTINNILRLGVFALGNKDCRSVLEIREKGETKRKLPEFDYANDKSGFIISRNGFTPESNYLLMSAKTGCGYTGHNHMDMLSLILSIRGREIIAEPYAGMMYHKVKMHSPQRGYMYNMTSHNTVLCYSNPVMNDMMYSNKWGVYRPDSPIKATESTEDGFYAEAFHTAYTFCLHRRKLYFERNLGLIVHDKVERGNRYEDPHIARWNLAIGCSAEKLSEHSVIIRNDGVSVLMIAKEAEDISIWKNSAILVPDIVKSEDELAPILDVRFKSPDRLIADNAPADLHTLFLDITGKEDKAEARIADLEALLEDRNSLSGYLETIRRMSEMIK